MTKDNLHENDEMKREDYLEAMIQSVTCTDKLVCLFKKTIKKSKQNLI